MTIALVARTGAAFAARRLHGPPALARRAVHNVAHRIFYVAVFVLIAAVVAVIAVDGLRREAAAALARPKGHA
jgi:hypothetical protein